MVISVGIAPPALPVYTQPLCPGDGYLWTPGYWAYGPAGYYWVPGVWVQPPGVGLLWTPGYWGWGGSAYLFHAGYWGPHVGFYGGVNYGFGFGGVGYEGGYWNNGHFAYNRAVNNVNVTNIHNVYNKTVVVNNITNNRVSYNGGNGGLQARAGAQEQAAMRENHMQPTGNQIQHQQFAAQDRGQLASANGGRPMTAAARTPGEYHQVAQGRFAVAPGGAGNRPGQNVAQRQGDQQQRIANGIGSGQMTAGEAARSEQREQNIHQQVRTDRQASGGHLDQAQHQQIQREQNAESRQICNENHNGAGRERPEGRR
jgi:chorismate mutase